MLLQPDIGLENRLYRLSRYLLLFVISIGFLVLLGWQFNIEIFKRPIPRLVAMNPVTALAFTGSGISLLLLTSGKLSVQNVRIGKVLAFIILFIGIARLLAFVPGFNFNIDYLLFKEKISKDIIGNTSNRMAPNTAMGFVFAGISLLLNVIKVTPKKIIISQWFAILTFCIALFSIIGYIYGVQVFYRVSSFIPMAVHTAVCFLFISLAILFAGSGQGIMKRFTGNATGSQMARLLIPFAIIAPVIAGLLSQWGQHSNYNIFEFRTGVLVFIIILIFLGFIWYSSGLLNKRELLKRETEIALEESKNQIQTIFNAAPDAVILIDGKGIIVRWNPKAEEIFGWTAAEVMGTLLSESIVPLRYREAHIKGLSHFFATGKGPLLGKSIEIRALRKDNTELDISLSISPTVINGQYLCIGFIRDITDKKKNQDEINYLAKLVDQTSEAIISTDNDYVIRTWNRGAELLYGYTAEEAINKEGVNIIEPQITEEDRNKTREQLQKKGYWTGELKHKNKQGDTIFVLSSMTVTKDNSANPTGLVVVNRDVTGLKKAEESIRYNSLLLQNVSDAVISTDENLLIRSWNEAAQKIYGYSEAEVLDKNISLIRLRISDETIRKNMETLQQKGFYKDEYTAVNKNGEEITILASINIISSGDKITGYVAVHRDITKRKQLEQQLRKFNEDLSEKVEEKTAEIKNIFERITDAFIALDINWCCTYMNKKAGEIFNRDPERITGKNIWTKFPDEEALPYRKTYETAMTDQQYTYLEEYYSPLKKWLEIHIYPSPDGLSIFFQDITGKKITEEKLAQNEKRFRALVENNEGIISLVDEKLHVLFRSASAARITGWTNDEFEKTDAKEYIHPDDLEEMKTIMVKATQNPGMTIPIALRVRHKEGNYIWLEGVVKNMIHDPAIGGVVTNMRDITERKEAEEKIIKATRLYYFISQINQMIVRTTDEQTLFKEACNIAIDFGKFKMAWVGLIDEENKTVVPVMCAGDDGGYLSAIRQISIHDIPEGRGPTGTAIREGKYIVCNDLDNDPQMAPWTDEIKNKGYKSSMALPIKKFGKVIGAFSFYMSVKNFFDAEEIVLLQEATGDVSFALEILAKEELRRKREEEIKISNERFVMVAMATNDAVFELDLITGESWHNEAFLQLFNMGSADFTIKPDTALWRSKLHPDDSERVIQKLQAAYAGTTPVWADEFRFQKADGNYGNFYDRGFITRDKSGKAIRIIGSMTDITELKKVEGQLKESEEKYRSLIEQASDAIIISDEAGNFLDMNKSACDLLGYTKAKLRTMKIKDLYTTAELTTRPIMQKELQRGDRISLERNILHSDGSEIPVEVTAKMLSDRRIVSIVRDISERKKAEEKIRKSNERFELIGQAANDAVWEWNLETNEVWGNETHQQLYGLTLADPVPDENEWKRRLHPEDRELTLKSIEDTLASAGNIWDGEYRLNTENKGWTDIYGRTYIERNATGKPIRLLGSMMDISERKKAEKKIKESEEKYRSLIEQASDPIVIYSLDGKIQDYNNAFMDFTGYNKKDTGTLVLTDLLFAEDIKERPLHFSGLKNGLSVHDIRRAKKKDGSAIHIDLNSKIMPDGNIMAIARDITERMKAEQTLKESEEKYRSLFERNLAGVYQTTLEGIILTCNKVFATMLGYDSPKELLGKNTSLLYFSETGRNNFMDRLKKETELNEEEVKLLHKDGKPVFVIENCSLRKDKETGIEIVEGVIIDITERKKAEERLNQSYQEIRRLVSYLQNIREDERIKIAREIHDELGQQLTVMKMDISWLNKRLGKTDEAIKDKTEALKDMLDQTVQSVRRISSELRPSVLDDMGLAVAIEWHLNEFEKRVRIKTHLNKNVPELELSELVKTGLFRIVQESLTNVARYAKAKNVTVTLQHKEDTLMLVIQDDGIGFDKEKIAAKKTLGIVGMRERTNMMGGTYEINSLPGEGTMVVVKVPFFIS